MDDGLLRTATPDDSAELLGLWALVYDEDGPWRPHAAEWFARAVGDPRSARFPVIEAGGAIVATAIGTLELGVPNPHCLRGRTVRLANVITRPGQRRRGHGERLVADVLDWARSIGADRVDLSATPDGRRLYEKLGFTLTSAPRMKLVLGRDR